MPTRSFALQLTFVAAIAAGGAAWLQNSQGSWEIATDVQKYYQCLPFDWYVVINNLEGYEPQAGDLVRFEPPAHADRLSDQFEVIKIVAAVAGDTWAIKDDELSINGRTWGGMPLLTTLELSAGALDGEGVVPEGHVMVLGTNPSSYDSRYWGPLEAGAITGKAHVLL